MNFLFPKIQINHLNQSDTNHHNYGAGKAGNRLGPAYWEDPLRADRLNPKKIIILK